MTIGRQNEVGEMKKRQAKIWSLNEVAYMMFNRICDGVPGKKEEAEFRELRQQLLRRAALLEHREKVKK